MKATTVVGEQLVRSGYVNDGREVCQCAFANVDLYLN